MDLVYDKDDFPYDDFDNTQFSAEGRSDREIKAAWSNESIELWFCFISRNTVRLMEENNILRS